MLLTRSAGIVELVWDTGNVLWASHGCGSLAERPHRSIGFTPAERVLVRLVPDVGPVGRLLLRPSRAASVLADAHRGGVAEGALVERQQGRDAVDDGRRVDDVETARP